MTTTARLDKLAARYAAKPAVVQLNVALEQPRNRFTWSWGATDSPYFVASITKLFTVAVIMQLRAEGAITLDLPVADVLGAETVRGLVVHNNVDHGPLITIGQLLAQTSGIPDYYDLRDSDGRSMTDRIHDEDEYRTLDDFLELARALPSPYPPGQSSRAHYSDINYKLLGRVVETCTGERFETVVRHRVIDPLDLQNTWHFTREDFHRYDDVTPVYWDQKRLRLPATLSSAHPDGGIVSTTADQIRFLRAFTRGELFPEAYLSEMSARWNALDGGFGPLRYGVGLMRFALPRWQTLFTRMPAMIGHSGSFGSVLYYAPESDLFVAATVNQISPKSLPYPLLARISMLVR